MNETPPAIEVHDIPVAFSLLTRLPVPVDHARAGLRGARAGWAWPLVGAIIGAVAGAVGWALMWTGLSPTLSAGLALAVLVLMTGALHEDGLADCADGLGGGRDKSRALDIMKDSRVGAFGVVALVLALGLRWQSLALFDGAGLLVAMMLSGATSRAVMLAVMAWMPLARSEGLSASTGQPRGMTVAIGTGLTLIAVLLIAPASLIAIVLLPLPLIILALRKIGGQTGDVLGGVQQLAEIGCLLGLSVVYS